MASTTGRRVVVPLTNQSGGGIIAGDVVVIDTAHDDSFTTDTSGGFVGTVGIAQETIASGATGQVLLQGEAALVNVNASVTRGHFGKTYTVAKQATDAGASRGVGTFCQFKTGGTTPKAVIFPADLGAGSGMTNPMTTTGDMIYSSSGSTPARLAAVAAGQVLQSQGTSTAPAWGYTFPKLVQAKNAGNAVTSVTLDGAPASGNVLLAGVMSTTGQVSAMTCTNVTWTQIATVGPTTGGIVASYAAIWVGKVSGAGGTSVSFTKPGGNATISVIELAGVTVTPTLSSSATAVIFPFNKSGVSHVTPPFLAATTAGHLLAFLAAPEDEAYNTLITPSIPAVGLPFEPVALVAAFSLGGAVTVNAFVNQVPTPIETDSKSGALIIAEIT